jgi:membrane protease subunit HflK
VSDDEENVGTDEKIKRQVGRTIVNWIVLGASLGVIGAWAYTGLFQLEPGEAGVVLRVGSYNRTILEPGLKWILPPPIEEVSIINVTEVRRLKFGMSEVSGAMEPGAETATFENSIQTADSNIVNLSYEVQYTLEDPFSFLYKTANPQEMLHDAAQAAVREVVGRTNVEGVLSEERGRIQRESRQILQTTLDSYFAHDGAAGAFDIDRINLNIVQPPAQVQDAFDDVIAAQQDEARVISEARGDAQEILERANAVARELVESATGYKDATILEARGEADRFIALHEEYAKAPEVTRRRLYLETMEQVMPEIEKVIIDQDSTNLLPFFPLQQRTPSAGPTQ